MGQDAPLDVVARTETPLHPRVVQEPFALAYTLEKRPDLLPHYNLGSPPWLLLVDIILVQKLDDVEVLDQLRVAHHHFEIHHPKAAVVFVVTLVDIFKPKLLGFKV